MMIRLITNMTRLVKLGPRWPMASEKPYGTVAYGSGKVKSLEFVVLKGLVSTNDVKSSKAWG